MHEELRGVSEHMRNLGLAALAHAMQHTIFYSSDNKFWGNLAILQAAHSAEILIKACIAEQHPLLIFTELPKSTQVGDKLLNLKALIESGKTIQYQDLPERLWASTGYKIRNIELYKSFGKLRNSIQHFASPEGRDLMRENLEFIFGLIDPLIHDFWKLYAIDFIEDPDGYEFVLNTLIQKEISFLYPEEYKEDVENEKRNPLYGQNGTPRDC
ncbi:MAG TPA: hypothetical protein V6D43_17215 [Candidatus Sericytochromatia bacterium]|jgi:hypothetical protein